MLAEKTLYIRRVQEGWRWGMQDVTLDWTIRVPRQDRLRQIEHRVAVCEANMNACWTRLTRGIATSATTGTSTSPGRCEASKKWSRLTETSLATFDKETADRACGTGSSCIGTGRRTGRQLKRSTRLSNDNVRRLTRTRRFITREASRV